MRKLVLLSMVAIIVAGTLFIYYCQSKQNASQIAIVRTVLPTPFEEGEENKQDGQRERLEHENLMTLDPTLGYVPRERLIMAEQKAARMAMQSRDMEMASLSWTERGPNNMGGRSRAIMIDINDISGNTVFIGSVGGGLWKTTNFKAATPTWNQIASISANLAITSLAQDPLTPNTMYAGTGEGYNNVDAIRGLGIYKSTDGGTNWSFIANTTAGGTNVADFNYVQKILVYSNGNVYVAATSLNCNRGGIMRSTNGGTSWSRVIGFYDGMGTCAGAFDFGAYDIEMASNGDLYAAVRDYSNVADNSAMTIDTSRGKIFRSPAGATVGNVGTWTNITPAPVANSYWQRIELAVSGVNPNTVFAIMQGTGNGVSGIRVSTNAGTSWTNRDNATLWCDQGFAGSTDFSRGQAWYDLLIAAKPDNDNTIFVGGVDIMKSTNGGATWNQNTQWADGCATLPNIHADNHNLVHFPGSPNEFIIVNDGGIYYSNDNGVSYSNKSVGYRTIQYYSTAIHPSSGSNYMLAGAQDNGTQSFSAAGLGAGLSVTGGDGGFCGI
ncbi:MAG: WD40/YVTN/BNR-like repeat-containing protein, partial [Flavisolibacter sp.]